MTEFKEGQIVVNYSGPLTATPSTIIRFKHAGDYRLRWLIDLSLVKIVSIREDGWFDYQQIDNLSFHETRRGEERFATNQHTHKTILNATIDQLYPLDYFYKRALIELVDKISRFTINPKLKKKRYVEELEGELGRIFYQAELNELKKRNRTKTIENNTEEFLTLMEHSSPVKTTRILKEMFAKLDIDQQRLLLGQLKMDMMVPLLPFGVGYHGY